MSRAIKLVILSVTVLLGITAFSSRLASAWCLGTLPWEQNLPIIIPVYVNEDMAEMCYPTGNSFCDGFHDIEPTVRVAIDEFNDTSGANIRFSYAGSTSLLPGQEIAGAVHMYPVANLGALGVGQSADTDGDNKADLCHLAIEKTAPWLAMDGIGPDANFHNGMHGLVIHELMHCLGFAHTDTECEQPFQSVVKDGTNEKPHLFADDIDGLQAIYGLRSDQGRARRSTNISSWAAESLPSWLASARSRYSISAYRWRYAFLSYVEADTGRIGRARHENGSWHNFGLLSSSMSTEYHTGTAIGGPGDGDFLITFTGNYDANTGLQDVRYAKSTNGGYAWSAPVTISSTQTYNAGTAATYDPKSNSFIVLWREGNGSSREVMKQAVIRRADWTVDRHTVEWPSGTALRSADSPSIACGASWRVGAENCLMAWTTTQWDHFFYWVQGHVECVPGLYPHVDCEFVFSPASVLAYPAVVYGQPSVAHTGQSTYPWLITFHQGGTGAYTLRKGKTGDWHNLTAHVGGGRVVSPAAGSRKLGPSNKNVEIMYHGSY